MSWQDLLKKHNYTIDDVDELIAEKKEYLKEEKEHVHLTDPVTDEETRVPTGGVVTLRQSGYPIKLFVLEELLFDDHTELRLGYYIVSTKKLQNEGDLELAWGQFNPHLPNDDLKELMTKAEQAGLLE